MNVLTEKSLFKTDDIAIDFFSWADNPHKNIALTFTPFGMDGEVSLSGVGYGGELLLRNGFDVVAFKSARNLWYQNLLPETIAEVENFISSHSSQYTKRVGYGSSMGGYAVIQFSRDLKLDVVLALSPQFPVLVKPWAPGSRVDETCPLPRRAVRLVGIFPGIARRGIRPFRLSATYIIENRDKKRATIRLTV